MKYALYLLFALSSVFGTAQSIPYTIELIDRNQTPTFFKELYGLLEADDGVYFAHEFGFAPTLYVVSYFDGVNYTELYTSSGKLLLMEAIQGSVFVAENTDGATGDDNVLLVRQTGSVDTVSTDPFSFMPDTYERNDIMIVTSSGEHILAYNADGEEEILANNPSGSGFIFQFNDYGERTLMHARNNYYFTDGTAAGTTRVFEEATGGFNVNLFPYANSLVLVDNDGIASYDFVTTQTQYVTSNEYSSRDNATLSPNGILFTARNTASERKIYVTDGTEEGTTVLTSLPPGLENGIEEFYDFYEGVSSPHIFFSPVQTGDSRQIWVSDGTYDGTYMLFEVPAEVSATVRLKQPGVSNDDVIVTANVEASGDNSLYVYRYKPTQPNITATLLAILTENSAFSIHLINDYLLYGAGSFFEETLYALDLITGDTTSLGIVRENIQEPLMELSDQIFYLNGGDNNTIDTIVATRGPEAGLRPIIATNSRTYSSSLPTSLFFIEDELYAYIFDVVTGESIVRIDRQMLTTSLVVDLFPNNSSSANADMAEVGGRLLVRGDNSMQIFSGGSVTSTISTFGDPAFSSLNRLIGNIGDKYYFDKTSFTFTIGLYELDIVTGEIRDLTFLLQNEFGNQDDAFVIVNDKIYTIGTSIEDDSYLNTFMEIDPEASTATVISTTHGGGPTQLNNRSLATDGSVIYLTRNLGSGQAPVAYDPVTGTFDFLAEATERTYFYYFSIGEQVAVQFSNANTVVNWLSTDGVGTQLNTTLTRSAIVDFGSKILVIKDFNFALWAVDKSTGSTEIIQIDDLKNIRNITYVNDNLALFLGQRDSDDTWELWSTNGTQTGSRMITNLGSNFSFDENALAVNGDFALIRFNNSSIKLIDLRLDIVQEVDAILDNTAEQVVATDNRFYFIANHPQFSVEPHFLTVDAQDLLTGSVFNDANANGIKDAEETGIPNYPVYISGNAEQRLYTDQEGTFSLLVGEGYDYSFAVPTTDCYDSITTPSSFDITYSADSTYQIDFGLRPIPGPASLRTLLNSSTIRCGFEHDFWLTILNDGCLPLAGEGSVTFPEEMAFIESDEAPLSNENNTLIFAFDTLQPGSSQRYRIRFRLPDENFAGLPIDLAAAAGAMDVDGAMIESDTFAYSEILRCAIDPNDKQVSPSRTEPSNSNYTQIDETIRYTIRFQNTGNDTAFTVRIEDQISESLNLETLKPLAASHPYSVAVRNDRTLVFLFEDILLPDSTTNLPGSQGFVTFEINAHPGLEDFSSIDNTAGIYFDFNQPVITNTVASTFVEFLDEDQDGFLFYEECNDRNFDINPNAAEIPNNGIDENCDDLDDFPVSSTQALQGTLRCFPSPTSGLLALTYTDNTPLNGELYSASGVRIRKFSFQKTLSLNLSALPAGLYLIRLYSPEEGRGAVIRVVRE